MFSVVMNVADQYKIEGESILTGYEKWIDVVSIEHEVALPMTLDKSSNSRTAGRPDLKDFVVGMLVNKAYPKFVEVCAAGKNLGTVVVKTLRVNDGNLSEILSFTLKNVYVSDVELSCVDPSNAPTGPIASVSLNYDAITVSYSEVDNTGKTIGSISSAEILATA
jgi:type VI secretion system Hcp family effector